MVSLHRWARASALGLFAALYLAVPGCGSDAFSGCPQGQETCSCYGNKTCDAELTCLSNVCVRAGAGTGGHSASGGGSGTSVGGTGSNRGGTGSSGSIGSSAAGGDDATGAGAGGDDAGGAPSTGGSS